MKSLSLISPWLLAAAMIMIACEDRFSEDEGRDLTSESVTATISLMNTNIRALYEIAEAGMQNSGVKACIPFKEGNGYALLFDNGLHNQPFHIRQRRR